jgi:hypothetical protein
MAKSIVQEKRECLICGNTENLHLHHIFYGTANRKLSDKYGLTCFLCNWHHNGSSNSVHFNKAMDDKLKKFAQTKFEEVYGANTSFVEVFGKNFK